MIVNLESVPVTRWPHSRWTKSGAMVVHGRCLGALRWKLMRTLCRWSSRAAGLYLFAAAFLLPAMAIYEWAPESAVGNAVFRQLLWLRSTARDVLVEDFPKAGALIHYTGKTPYDLHMGGAGFLLFVLSRHASTVLALVLCGITWPLIARRIKLTFTPEKIVLHRWWGGVTLNRNDQENPITFRTVDLAAVQPFIARAAVDQNSAGQNTSFGTKAAMLMHGLRNHLIARPLRPQRSEQIVVACHIAMKETRSLTITGDRRH